MSQPILHHQQFGESGQPLIAIHGLFGSLENLGMITRQLAADYRVYAVDLPNHGGSLHTNDMTIASMADRVSQWMAAMGIDSAHFLGHSLGGKVCMEIALTFPSIVKSLIVADIAPVSYPSRHDNVFKGLRAVDIGAITSRSQADQQMQAHITGAATRLFLLKNLAKVNGCWRWRINLDAIETHYPALLAENTRGEAPYQNPVLFIKGQHSDYLLPAYRDQILERFPNAVVREIQQTGHWLHAEKPDAFVRIVKRFLAPLI